ncbi:hypothetical protein H5410_022117 [Solanum commersonii]|uniref:Uncharacterized protein n=1 Tax=Solanum commersonii TaxID=4109 RepID=A0A9J5ZH50_SOLCO|nr:hypothetical protein H5410_022117 [Solanum commersonii]
MIVKGLRGFHMSMLNRKLVDITTHLIPLCDDEMLLMTRKLALSNHSKYDIIFFVEMKFFGVRLWYKNEPELCIRIRRSRYEHNKEAGQLLMINSFPHH